MTNEEKLIYDIIEGNFDVKKFENALDMTNIKDKWVVLETTIHAMYRSVIYQKALQLGIAFGKMERSEK